MMKQTIEAYFHDVINHQQIEKIADYLSDDYENEDDPSGMPGWQRTYFYYKELLKMFPDMQVRLEHLRSLDSEHAFLAHWQASGYDEKYILIMRVDDNGKICYRRSRFLNTQALKDYGK